jgi:hypothetical protein
MWGMEQISAALAQKRLNLGRHTNNKGRHRGLPLHFFYPEEKVQAHSGITFLMDPKNMSGGGAFACLFAGIQRRRHEVLCPWMEFFVHRAQVLQIQVCVYLCGGYAGVSQKHLYYAQVSPAFQQMGRKGVAQGVRGDLGL